MAVTTDVASDTAAEPGSSERYRQRQDGSGLGTGEHTRHPFLTHHDVPSDPDRRRCGAGPI